MHGFDSPSTVCLPNNINSTYNFMEGSDFKFEGNSEIIKKNSQNLIIGKSWGASSRKVVAIEADSTTGKVGQFSALPEGMVNFNPNFTRGSKPITNIPFAPAVFLGVVQEIAGSGSWSTNSRVYYDPAVRDNIVWAQVPLYRRSWKESGRSCE